MRRTLALFGVALLPGILAAQAATLTGTVADSASRRPVTGVVVTAKELSTGAVSRLLSDSGGHFRLATSAGGSFSLDLVKLGYRPIHARVITIAPGKDATVELSMAILPVWLDTVVTTANLTLFKLTPGRELYRQHMLEGKGQFVTVLEIQQSGLRVSEYLGTLPGIRLAEAVPMKRVPHTLRAAPSLPSIPARDLRQLIAATGTHCLYGRVDRFFIVDLLLDRQLDNIDDLLNVDDITGIEVYLVQRDMPAEWRSWMYLAQVLVPREGQDSTWSALMGRPPRKRETPDGPCGFLQIWTRIAW